MAKLSPAEAAAKWANNLSAATQNIANGVDRVTVAPTASAANAKAKMLQNITAAINSGKWENGLRRVTLDDWKNAMKTKGINRIASGAQAAVPQQTDFYSKLLPFEDNLRAKVKSMPKMTLSDGVARATAWIQGMAQFKK